MIDIKFAYSLIIYEIQLLAYPRLSYHHQIINMETVTVRAGEEAKANGAKHSDC